MKLSRNVLVGSLAVSGMVLGALAPAMTAQAATGSAQFNKTTGAYEKATTDVGSLTKDGHDLAIAYDSMPTDGSTADYGTATATSNANVNVISGILVLDAVPNFGFGSGAAGATVALDPKAKTSGTGVDGNDDGVLQVTDARETKTENEDKTVTTSTKGFALNASMAAFTDTKGGTIAKGDGFTLNLTPQAIVDGTGANATTSATDITTSTAALDSKGTAASVIAPAAGAYKVGTLKAAYDTAAAANLSIPDGVGGADNTVPSTKAMQSVITWTLNADPASVIAPAAK